ncbi:universal stress protein [Methanocella arvoryzae]|uniref:Universal stress protein A n=1 Tax=Methanocella arvoryzae (strain DSM 22066 / NBRC 105507 / MRE50) TaxID=351160 RepID=Q0W888_METAR|nr:universal stress protein [Methanocella arvoryzae]CAJ35405.1 universal stress protein A [Methanocella arvoryzae MRE50]
MGRILIATDGSKYSNLAVDYGVMMARKLGYDVLGLYVVNMKSLEIYALEHHDNISGYEAENARLKKEGEAALGYLSAKCNEQDVKVSTTIVRGYPAEDIIKLAESEKVNMIIVGNLGKTNLEYMFMGSVSETVVKRAPCPVLVVRGKIDMA